MCGYKEGEQDNWLITQYIRRLVGSTNVRLSSLTVLLEIELPGSATHPGDTRMFTTHIYEAPYENAGLATRVYNYRLLTREATTGLIGKIKKTFRVDFTSNTNGFYLAIRDRGTCLTIQRFVVHYAICPRETRDFAIAPETVAPTAEVTVECVEGAGPENGVHAKFNCLETGNWNSIPGAGCRQCDPGTKLSEDRRSCVAQDLAIVCPAGDYLSVANAECRVCPGNSESTVSGLTVCPCVDGYYRAEGEDNKACTSKYIIHYITVHINVQSS